MMHENYEEEGHEECCGHMHMGGAMKKEFKLAMLEKKEKMIQAKLEFIGKMKEFIKKMPEEKE
jgi:hypothetical protein